MGGVASGASMREPPTGTIETVRGGLGRETGGEILAFWAEHGALAGEQARARLPEVVCVLRDDAGRVAGVNSAFADERGADRRPPLLGLSQLPRARCRRRRPGHDRPRLRRAGARVRARAATGRSGCACWSATAPRWSAGPRPSGRTRGCSTRATTPTGRRCGSGTSPARRSEAPVAGPIPYRPPGYRIELFAEQDTRRARGRDRDVGARRACDPARGLRQAGARAAAGGHRARRRAGLGRTPPTWSATRGWAWTCGSSGPSPPASTGCATWA